MQCCSVNTLVKACLKAWHQKHGNTVLLLYKDMVLQAEKDKNGKGKVFGLRGFFFASPALYFCYLYNALVEFSFH